MTITDGLAPMTFPTVRRAVAPDRREVGRVLAAGFLDDPTFAWITPSRRARAAWLPTVFDAFARAFERHGATDAVDRPEGAGLVGVALWAPPGVPAVHPDDEHLLEAASLALDPASRERLGRCSQVFAEAHPEEPAWYLNFMATDPASQGRGVGTALLEAVLAAADAAGEAAYLDATSARNRVLYERHGFRCIGELTFPDGPTAYSMWRDPA